MSTQTGPGPAGDSELPEDPEAVVDELSADSGEDYDPPERVDPDREATEADMIEQAVEVPHDDDEATEPAAD